MLGMVEFLPFLLFSLPAGVWVDRLRAGRCSSPPMSCVPWRSSTVPVAYWLDVLTIWQLYVVAFVLGVGTVFFDVSYQSYLPTLVRRDQLVDGNSELEVGRSAAHLGGPGLAGGAHRGLTAPVAVLVDAISFVVSALLIRRIRRTEPNRRRPRPTLTALGARRRASVRARAPLPARDGSVGRDRELLRAGRRLDLARLPRARARDERDDDRPRVRDRKRGFPRRSDSARRVEARLGVGRTILGSSMLAVPGLLLVPLAPRDFAVPVLIASGLIVGFAIVLYNVTAISLMQAITPDRLLGRMNASRRFFVWGVIPLGAITGGVLATTIGLRPTLLVGAIGGCRGSCLCSCRRFARSCACRTRISPPRSRPPAARRRSTATPGPGCDCSRASPSAHCCQSLRVGGEPGERLVELRARRLVVQVGGDRADGPVVELESAARVAAGREQQLRPAQRRPPLLLVELDPLPGEPGQA